MKKHSPAWYDSMYNNRMLVPDFANYFARWQALSAQARGNLPCKLNIPYGNSPAETLDLFTTQQPGAPVVVFIHGGYWRSLDKADHSFVAKPITELGAIAVVINYSLAPEVDVPTICLQNLAALDWVYRNIAQHGGDPKRIHLVGHSAGGHLAAMLMACRWSEYANHLPARLVQSALSISGLHELESVRKTPFLQASLNLTKADAVRASPAWMPAPKHAILHAVAGGDESAEFKRQARLIQKKWGKKRVPNALVLPKLNHFSIVESLLQKDSELHRLLAEIIQS